MPNHRATISINSLNSLGQELDGQLQTNGNFSQVSNRLLKKYIEHHHWNEQEFVSDFFENGRSSQFNPNGNYGQPPMTVFKSEKNNFYIEVYLWLDVHSNIHDHGFEGAFVLLQGISLEATYTFHESQRISSQFSKGDLIPKNLEIIKPLDVKMITLGNNFIHQVLHVGTPSYTLIIRTKVTINELHQSYDTRKESFVSKSSDFMITKKRLMEYMVKAGMITLKELSNKNFLERAEFSLIFADDPDFKQFKPEAYLEILNTREFDNLIFKLPQNEKILLSSFDFFRNKQRIYNWYNNNQNPEQFLNCFENLLNFLMKEKILSQEMKDTMVILWSHGVENYKKNLQIEQLVIDKLRDQIPHLLFINFIFNSKNNP